MIELPDRYRQVINGATDLDEAGKRKMNAILAALYPVFAAPPPPIDDTGSVWF